MSVELEIRRASAGDLDGIADLVGALNARADQRCLMCPETPKDVRRDMADYGEHPQDHFVLAFRDGRLVGAVSCDWVEEQGRGWILGPFVIPEEWSAAAPLLFKALLERVPKTIRRLDTYTDLPNTLAMDLYLGHGFEEFRRAPVYCVTRESFAGWQGETGIHLDASQEDAFLALHARSFPEAPDPGPDLLARRDGKHPIFAVQEGEALLGYLAAKINAAPVEGFVDYLAVDEQARGRGLGTRLLGAALAWFFTEKQMPQVSLIVHETNHSARGIYERAGFRLLYTGVATRRFL